MRYVKKPRLATTSRRAVRSPSTGGVIAKAVQWHRTVVAGVLVTAFALAGCAAEGEAPIPLPGGAPSGDHYTVRVDFTDVMDLVPEASVKVNDVTVGSVEKIKLHGWDARVWLRIDKKVKLPDNTSAALRQTSLLGEKFVALVPPETDKSPDPLEDGELIPVSRTRRSVEVEEVLGAMSLLLNGGGLAHLKTINKEIGDALEGREKDVKGTLKELNTFIKGLEDQKKDIVRAIDALDTLSKRLAKERGTVAKALDAMGPGMKVLADQRDELVSMLGALRDLGDVGTKVIRKSRDDTTKVLRDLQPILTQLVKAGDNLPKALDYLLTFPLPPEVTKAIYNDRVNLHVTLDLDAVEILKNLTRNPEPMPNGDEEEDGPTADDPSLPGVPDLPPGASESRQGGLTDLLLSGMTR